MMEMAVVLTTCLVLVAIAYEFVTISTREWGENFKSFF